MKSNHAMTNLNSRQRKMVYTKLLVKQGDEFCVLCTRNPKQLAEDGLSNKLCIDHIDNNNNNNRIENLQFLCHSCNTKKNHPTVALPQSRQMTPEMAFGKSYERRFRKWVMGLMLDPDKPNLFTWKHLQNSGAEMIGCSPMTINRYLTKMTSGQGLYHCTDRDGEIYVKTDIKPEDEYYIDKSGRKWDEDGQEEKFID